MSWRKKDWQRNTAVEGRNREKVPGREEQECDRGKGSRKEGGQEKGRRTSKKED